MFRGFVRYLCFLGVFRIVNAFIPVSVTERNFLPSFWRSRSVTVNNTSYVPYDSSRTSSGLKRDHSNPPPRSGYHPPFPQAQPGHYGQTGYFPGPGATYPSHHFTYPPPQKPQYSASIHVEPVSLVLQCIVEDPLEHIIWLRYPCPGQYSGGVLVAEGSTVFDKKSYDIHILGANGTFKSNLLIKKPLDAVTGGVYRCEAWPHDYHATVASHDEYLLGGKDVLTKCFIGYNSNGGYGNTGGHFGYGMFRKLNSTEYARYRYMANNTSNNTEVSSEPTSPEIVSKNTTLNSTNKEASPPVSSAMMPEYRDIVNDSVSKDEKPFMPSVHFQFLQPRADASGNNLITPPPKKYYVVDGKSYVRFDFSSNNGDAAWGPAARRVANSDKTSRSVNQEVPTVDSRANKSIYTWKLTVKIPELKNLTENSSQGLPIDTNSTSSSKSLLSVGA